MVDLGRRQRHADRLQNRLRRTDIGDDACLIQVVENGHGRRQLARHHAGSILHACQAEKIDHHRANDQIRGPDGRKRDGVVLRWRVNDDQLHAQRLRRFDDLAELVRLAFEYGRGTAYFKPVRSWGSASYLGPRGDQSAAHAC